jgi:predicted nucleotide-binding protein
MGTEQLISPAPADEPGRRVFVVGGRDQQVRRLVFDLLRALGLRPQEWEALVAAAGSTAPSLLDVVDRGVSPDAVQAVVVLLTPDDVVSLHPELHGPREHDYEVTPRMQARPDVLIEAGMALARFRERTILVEFGVDLRPISDLGGINVIRFAGTDLHEPVAKLAGRLRLAGCPVDESGIDWRDPDRFAGLGAYTRRPSGSGLVGRLVRRLLPRRRWA